MLSADFDTIAALQHAGKWEQLGDRLAQDARAIEAAGADFLVLATNTMHKVAPAIESAIRIPLLHIADVTGAAIVGQGIGAVGLLGTKFTTAEEFYRARRFARSSPRWLS